MLLRRLLAHVKDQNWTAVLLDFFIVVFGVFIGIQVDNWNQSRISQQQERQFLELLVRDLKNDMSQLDMLKDGIGHHVNSTGLIVDSAESGSFLADEIERAFTYLYLTLDYTPPTPTYTGLRNGANLDIMRDADLRSQVVDYYEVNQAIFRDDYVSDYTQAQAELHEHFWRYVRFRVPDNPYVPTPMPNDLDWTTLLTPITDDESDIHFLNDLSEIEGRGAEILVVLDNLEQENLNLQSAILGYLN
jgi:hypothetical protein